jgi:hypothetical protein
MPSLLFYWWGFRDIDYSKLLVLISFFLGGLLLYGLYDFDWNGANSRNEDR